MPTTGSAFQENKNKAWKREKGKTKQNLSQWLHCNLDPPTATSILSTRRHRMATASYTHDCEVWPLTVHVVTLTKEEREKEILGRRQWAVFTPNLTRVINLESVWACKLCLTPVRLWPFQPLQPPVLSNPSFSRKQTVQAGTPHVDLGVTHKSFSSIAELTEKIPWSAILRDGSVDHVEASPLNKVLLGIRWSIWSLWKPSLWLCRKLWWRTLGWGLQVWTSC